jgi:hypothetical protein
VLLLGTTRRALVAISAWRSTHRGCARVFVIDHRCGRIFSGDHLHHGLLANDFRNKP